MGNSLQPNQILCSIGCWKVVQNDDVKVGVPNLIIFGLHFFIIIFCRNYFLTYTLLFLFI
jgi:hypothetical protein